VSVAGTGTRPLWWPHADGRVCRTGPPASSQHSATQRPPVPLESPELVAVGDHHHAGDDDCTSGDCPRCHGIGYLPDEADGPDCPTCDGTGWVS
jgi:hypothetical protein